MADRPTARDVKAHVDEAARAAGLAMACIWGATQGTAPADRWDMAAADLQAASDALDAAKAAFGAMEKPEAYCTVCGEPILSLMAGWSHFSPMPDRGVDPKQAGHKPALGWREIGTPGVRTPLCRNCRDEPAMDDNDGLCWSCGEGDDDE